MNKFNALQKMLFQFLNQHKNSCKIRQPPCILALKGTFCLILSVLEKALLLNITFKRRHFLSLTLFLTMQFSKWHFSKQKKKNYKKKYF